jgi:hypothetical protein
LFLNKALLLICGGGCGHDAVAVCDVSVDYVRGVNTGTVLK